MKSLLIFGFILALLFLLDVYAFQAFKTVFKPSNHSRPYSYYGYWAFSFLIYLLPVLLYLTRDGGQLNHLRAFLITLVFGIVLAKLFIVLILLGEDISRGIRWAFQKFSSDPGSPKESEEQLSRSAFVSKLALLAGGVPLATMGYGVWGGAHDYQVREVDLPLPNLPPSFEGTKLVQVSDIHAGSFFNKSAVQRGIKQLMELKPDLVFFTGDLVNYRAEEYEPYLDIFCQVQAPLGVYSTLGNHDYGLYYNGWKDETERLTNVDYLKSLHRKSGWDILMNEHRIIEKDGDKLAVIGVENWSNRGHFPKLGDLSKARAGTEEVPVKLLLSHDPSHWEGEVLQDYPDINAMFSGHTHGMQFGIENRFIKWSPVKYMYKQWAGLYEQAGQYLYVNRGFGYIGYPGRVGIRPEITLFRLRALQT